MCDDSCCKCSSRCWGSRTRNKPINHVIKFHFFPSRQKITETFRASQHRQFTANATRSIYIRVCFKCWRSRVGVGGVCCCWQKGWTRGARVRDWRDYCPFVVRITSLMLLSHEQLAKMNPFYAISRGSWGGKKVNFGWNFELEKKTAAHQHSGAGTKYQKSSKAQTMDERLSVISQFQMSSHQNDIMMKIFREKASIRDENGNCLVSFAHFNSFYWIYFSLIRLIYSMLIMLMCMNIMTTPFNDRYLKSPEDESVWSFDETARFSLCQNCGVLLSGAAQNSSRARHKYERSPANACEPLRWANNMYILFRNKWQMCVISEIVTRIIYFCC